jgi:hypothetical protein
MPVLSLLAQRREESLLLNGAYIVIIKSYDIFERFLGFVFSFRKM